MSPTLRLFKTEKELRSHAVEFLENEFTQPAENGCPKGIMLSGGSTPTAIYAALSKKRMQRNETLRLFLSDERMVPADSPQSNARMLEALAKKTRVLAVDTAQSPEEAAIQFHHDLAREIELGMTIEVGLLGLGADGHTAGIFSNELAKSDTADYADSVQRADGLHGVTVTPALLKRVKKIIFIVVGESKKDMLTNFLNSPRTIPAGLAVEEHPDVEIWTDQDVLINTI